MDAWASSDLLLRHQIKQLWRILLDATTDQRSCHVICVLDALDECREEDRQILLALLSEFYNKSDPTSKTFRTSTLKFLVTSRPYYHIVYGFCKIRSILPTIRLSGDDKIHEEIDLVIRSRIAELARTHRLNFAQRNELETWLLKMEHRTYLWLHLAFKSIEKGYRYSLSPD